MVSPWLWCVLFVLVGRASSANVSDCDAWIAEFFRRQQSEFNQLDAFDGDTNVKHKPFIRIIGTTAVVTVGLRSVTGNPDDPLHPTTDSQDPQVIHFVDALYALDQNGAVVSMRRLSPRDNNPSMFSFSIPVGVTQITAYEHCNVHGLFRGESVYVSPEQTVLGAPRCNLQTCSATDMSDCNTTAVELFRQQVRQFNQEEPFDGDSNVKHKPYLKISGTTASIVVGLGAAQPGSGEPIHPMVASEDVVDIHWIDHIWATNQVGQIVAMRDLSATEDSPATFSFSIPEGTTKLTPFEHCNKHGIFVGDSVDISNSQTEVGQSFVCSARFCPGREMPIPPPVTVMDCTAMVADLHRRQQNEFSQALPFDGDLDLKHKPFIRVVNQTAVISVSQRSVTGNGSHLLHPMTDSTDPDVLHYIDTLYAVDQDDVVVALRRVSPRESPPISFTFLIPRGVTRLTAYEHCNIHGLFKGETVSIEAHQRSVNVPNRCTIELCQEHPDSGTCESTAVELARQHSRAFGGQPFFDASDSVKHAPYIKLSGSMATVVVGLGAVPGNDGQPIHPMTPSDDPAVAHWIDHIWATNQAGEIIAMRDLAPSEPSPASLTFKIPENATKLIGHEHCNLHGLFEGDAVDLTATQTQTGQVADCSLRFCPNKELGPEMAPATATDCDVFVAEIHRRQAVEFPSHTRPFECAADAMHCPHLTKSGTRASVVVGTGALSGDSSDPIHPMEFADTAASLHWIDTIYVVDQSDRIVAMRKLSPLEDAPATLVFDIPGGVTRLTPYQHCNIHGLFRGAAVEINETWSYAQAGCSIQRCTGLSARGCTAFTVEAARMQSTAFGQSQPFKGDLDEKHKPFIVVEGTTANIFVGKRAVTGVSSDPLHPMEPSSDPSKAHWISAIWAVDQHLRVVAYRDILPTEPAPASLSISIPEGVTMITAYEYCNKHGLFEGDKKFISENQTVQGLQVNPCGFRGCTAHMPSLGEAAAAAEERAREADELIDQTEQRQSVGDICGNQSQWGYVLEKKLSPNFYVFLTPNFTEQRAHFLICGKSLGWVGLGFPTGDHAMIDSDMIWGYVADDGTVVLEDRYAKAIEAPLLDDDLGGHNDLENISGWQECADAACTSGATFLQFSRNFTTPDAWDVQWSSEAQLLSVVYAMQSLNSDALTYHGPTRGHNTLPWNLVCANGTYLLIEEFTCEPCEIGFFRADPMPMTDCARCPLGKYSDRPGQSSCTPCPYDRSTFYPGASSADACLCAGGFYGDGASVCCKCQEGLNCPFGSDLQNYREALDILNQRPSSFSPEMFGPYPRLKPLYWSSVEEPTSVYRCKTANNCPGGEPGTCGPHQTSLACNECEPGYVLVGSRCEACLRDDFMHVVPFFALAPLFVLFVYKVFNFPIENADGLDRVLKNMVFVFLRMIQVIAIASNIDATMPSSVTVMQPISRVFLMDIEFMRLACGAAAFRKNYFVTLGAPFLWAVLFVCSYYFFLILSKIPGVSAYGARFGIELPLVPWKLFNTYMAGFNALYISLTNVATGIFQCMEHPNGKQSLRSARHVLCGEEAWMQMLPASLGAVTIFTLGFYIMIAYANYVAPAHFHKREFRRCWLFLLEKFRPGAWWWNQVIVTTALALNLTSIAFRTGAAQCYWIMGVLMAYSGGLAWHQPWRHWLLNTMDMIICYIMVAVVSLILWFVDHERHGDSLSVYFTFWISLLFAIPCVVMFVFICICVYRIMHFQDFVHQKLFAAREFQEMATYLTAADADSWNRFIITLSEGDRTTMTRCRDLIVAELLERQPSEYWHRKRLIFSSVGTKPTPFVSRASCSPKLRRSISNELKGINERTARLRHDHASLRSWMGGSAGRRLTKEQFDRYYGDLPSAERLFRALDVRQLGVIQTDELIATVDFAAGTRDEALVGLSSSPFCARARRLSKHGSALFPEQGMNRPGESPPDSPSPRASPRASMHEYSKEQLLQMDNHFLVESVIGALRNEVARRDAQIERMKDSQFEGKVTSNTTRTSLYSEDDTGMRESDPQTWDKLSLDIKATPPTWRARSENNSSGSPGATTPASASPRLREDDWERSCGSAVGGLGSVRVSERLTFGMATERSPRPSDFHAPGVAMNRSSASESNGMAVVWSAGDAASRSRDTNATIEDDLRLAMEIEMDEPPAGEEPPAMPNQLVSHGASYESCYVHGVAVDASADEYSAWKLPTGT